jgi:two-component system phosphate regulon sensor histidine kinase PhoR
MLHSRFFWKLYASYAALVVLSLTVVGILSSRWIATDTVRETERSLRVRAHLLHDIAIQALRQGPDSSLQQRVVALGRETHTRLTVIRGDGVVVLDSDEDPSTMDNHGSRPEVLAAREEGMGMATRFSRTVVANLMYVALAVPNGGEPLGYVRTSVSLAAVRERMAALRNRVVLGGVLAAVIALLIGLFVARRVTRPLASMTAVAEALAQGNYGERVGRASRDEVGVLAGAFNRMAGQLQERLQTITEDRSKLLTILGGMVEGVVAVDGDQRVVHLNAAAGRILGVSPEESVGRPIWEVTRIRQVGEAIEEALRASREVTCELELEIGAQDRVVELQGAPLQNGQGGLVGAVLVLHDVSELRRLETVRQDFVANVSHELKTPITAIRGLIDTIVDDPAMPADTKSQFLAKIQNQSLRLSRLVTDLLTLARLESVAGLLETEPLDLAGVVRRSAANFRSDAETRGIALSIEVPPEPVTVGGDGEALELMINNLLDNALKYTPRDGDVTVRLEEENDAALVSVRDTGIGMAHEHHDRVFERFYRVDKARSRELGGTGLGLSIVKHICKAHNASISVESAPASGSTFTVRIPVARNLTQS